MAGAFPLSEPRIDPPRCVAVPLGFSTPLCRSVDQNRNGPPDRAGRSHQTTRRREQYMTQQHPQLYGSLGLSRPRFESVRMANSDFWDGPNDVAVVFGPVTFTGDGHELAGMLDQAAAAVRDLLRRETERAHPSFDLGGSVYLSPGHELAVDEVNEKLAELREERDDYFDAVDAEIDVRTSSMARHPKDAA